MSKKDETTDNDSKLQPDFLLFLKQKNISHLSKYFEQVNCDSLKILSYKTKEDIQHMLSLFGVEPLDVERVVNAAAGLYGKYDDFSSSSKRLRVVPKSFNFDNPELFWNQLDDLLEICDSSKLNIDSGLFFYSKLTSDVFPLQNREKAMKDFKEEITRRWEVYHNKNLSQKDDRERILATFAPPSMGKSRMIDEFASLLSKEKTRFKAICFQISYNGGYSPTRHDKSKSESVAEAAFAWRIIQCVYKKMDRNEFMNTVFEKVENCKKITIHQALNLMWFHPSIAKIDKRMLFFGVDEIRLINETLDTKYVDDDENSRPKRTVHHIVTQVGRYYDTTEHFIQFFFSSLNKCEFKAPKTLVSHRRIQIISLPTLKIQHMMNIIKIKNSTVYNYLCGNNDDDDEKTEKSPRQYMIALCSGIPGFLKPILNYLETSSDTLSNENEVKFQQQTIFNKLYSIIYQGLDGRFDFDIFQTPFPDDKSLIDFLSKNISTDSDFGHVLSDKSLDNIYADTKENENIRKLLLRGCVEMKNGRFNLPVVGIFCLSRSNRLSKELTNILKTLFTLLLKPRTEFSENLCMISQVLHSYIIKYKYKNKPISLSQYFDGMTYHTKLKVNTPKYYFNNLTKINRDKKNVPFDNCEDYNSIYYASNPINKLVEYGFKIKDDKNNSVWFLVQVTMTKDANGSGGLYQKLKKYKDKSNICLFIAPCIKKPKNIHQNLPNKVCDNGIVLSNSASEDFVRSFFHPVLFFWYDFMLDMPHKS